MIVIIVRLTHIFTQIFYHFKQQKIGKLQVSYTKFVESVYNFHCCLIFCPLKYKCLILIGLKEVF